MLMFAIAFERVVADTAQHRCNGIYVEIVVSALP